MYKHDVYFTHHQKSKSSLCPARVGFPGFREVSLSSVEHLQAVVESRSQGFHTHTPTHTPTHTAAVTHLSRVGVCYVESRLFHPEMLFVIGILSPFTLKKHTFLFLSLTCWYKVPTSCIIRHVYNNAWRTKGSCCLHVMWE